MTELALEHVMASAIQKWALNIDICLPVTIDSYDSKELLANVIPDFDAEFYDGEIVEAPTVQRVPICFPMTSSKAIIFPLEPGDKAVLICSQRNLDNWKQGLSRKLKDATMFQLSDGFLIPGVAHKSMLAKHLLHANDAMNVLSEKLFLGDPNALINPLLASKGLKQRDLVGILKTLIDLLLVAEFGSRIPAGGGSIPTPLTISDPINTPILQAIGKELEELSTQ